MSLKAGAASAHIGGALSIADIVSVLFKYQMKNINENSNRDRFILSKGHACLAYYSALNLIGLISNDEIDTFEKDNSNLPVILLKTKNSELIFEWIIRNGAIYCNWFSYFI